MEYQKYAHLIGLPYIDGKQDCYGLVRAFYRSVYGIELRNYARPIAFDHQGLDLILNNWPNEGFDPCVDPELQPGDGLLFAVASNKINHVGVYVGNRQFLHQLYGKKSQLDPMDHRWYGRLLGKVRHPDVTEFNKTLQGKVSVLDLLPPHLKRRADHV